MGDVDLLTDVWCRSELGPQCLVELGWFVGWIVIDMRVLLQLCCFHAFFFFFFFLLPILLQFQADVLIYGRWPAVTPVL